MSAFHVRRDKAALFQWVQAPPAPLVRAGKTCNAKSRPQPCDLNRISLRISPGMRRPDLINSHGGPMRAILSNWRRSMPKTREKRASADRANALRKSLQPSEELAAVVGSGPLPRGQVVSKIWEYIRAHNLQTRRTAAKSWLTTSSRGSSARTR
jgi:hypothetical protein